MMDDHSPRHLVIVICILALVAVCHPWAPAYAYAQNKAGDDGAIAGDLNSFFSAPVRDADADSSMIEFQQTATTTELLESAREMFIADNYVLAEMLYKSVLVREPENLSAMLELAIVYETTDRLDYARGLLERAATISPYDETIAERQTAISKRLSGNLEVQVDSLLAKGRHEQALPKLALLLTTQPENAELLYKKAQCHLALERPDAALVEIDKALALRNDERYHTLRNLAMATLEGRRLDVLVHEAEQLLATGTPEDRAKALDVVTRILDVDPDHPWAGKRFRQLTDDRGDWGAPSGAILWIKARMRSLTRGFAATVGLFEILNRHLNVLILIFVVLVVFASPLTHRLLRGFAPRTFLAGQFEQFSIHEILTLINTHHLSGVLKVKSSGASGVVYFNKGEIDHCKSDELQGRKALHALIDSARDGYFTFGSARLPDKKTVDTPLSLILLDLPERKQDQTTQTPAKRRPSKIKTLLGKS